MCVLYLKSHIINNLKVAALLCFWIKKANFIYDIAKLPGLDSSGCSAEQVLRLAQTRYNFAERKQKKVRYFLFATQTFENLQNSIFSLIHLNLQISYKRKGN
jgi:hypothetical protein